MDLKEQGVTHIEDGDAYMATHVAEDHPESANYHVGLRTMLAIFALALTNCNATLSNTTNTIISFQVRAVGGGSVAAWIANGNFLMTLAMAPIFGNLADGFGKKWFIVGGCAIGIVGSFVSSAADNAYQIIGGNILVGVANAGCLVSIAANQETIPNRLRPYAFGFAQTINSIAAVVGVFLAAEFAEAASWAWSYRFNGIVYAVSGLMVLLTYSPPPTYIRRTTSASTILARVDCLGMLLLAGSLALLVIALTWGGSTYAWDSGVIIGTLVGGCVGLIVFGVFEWKVKRQNALLDHRLFTSLNFPVLCFVCMIDGILLLGINVLYAKEIAALFNADALHIAVILCPYLITSTLGCLPAGWIMSKTRSYRAMLVAALLWCSLFTGLMAYITSARLSYALAFSCLFGIGTAVTTVIPITALGLSVPSYLLGTATTLSFSARALGGIVGVTVGTAIYDNKISSALPKQVANVLAPAGKTKYIPDVVKALTGQAPPAVALQGIPGLPVRLTGPLLQALVKANASSWMYVWIFIACIILGAAFCSLFLKPVHGAMTSHVESALEHGATRSRQYQTERANDKV